MARKERVELNKYERRELRKRARVGATRLHLAEAFNVSEATVKNICKGIPLSSKNHIHETSKPRLKKVESVVLKKRRIISDQQLADVKRWSKEGYTQVSIAKLLGCDPSCVGKYLARDIQRTHKSTPQEGKAFAFPSWYVLVGTVLLLALVFVLRG